MDKYWTLSNFHEGLAYFEHYDNINDCIDRKGFIDKNGIEVLNLTEYKIINSFSEGLAAVSKDGNKFGFINTKGEIVIPCQYEGYSTEGDMLEFNDFHDGVCLVQTQNIYINKKNEIVLRVKKGVNCSDMSKGLALINEYNSGTNISTYGIVCLNGYNTLDHQDNDLALQFVAQQSRSWLLHLCKLFLVDELQQKPPQPVAARLIRFLFDTHKALTSLSTVLRQRLTLPPIQLWKDD